MRSVRSIAAPWSDTVRLQAAHFVRRSSLPTLSRHLTLNLPPPSSSMHTEATAHLMNECTLRPERPWCVGQDRPAASARTGCKNVVV